METLVFKMPSETEYVLAAFCILEAYEKMCLASENTQNRKGEWHATFLLSNLRPELHWLIKGRDTNRVQWKATSKEAQNEWDVQPDLYFEFDVERAMRLSKTTEIHVTRAFGTMLGAYSGALFPDLKPFVKTEELKNVIVDSHVILDILPHRKWRQAGLLTRFWDGYRFDKEILNAISESAMVIGPASAMTYAAASFGRTVVEMYPDKFHPGWFSKFTAGHYYLVPEHSPISVVSRAAEVAWVNTCKLNKNTFGARPVVQT